MRCKNQDKQRRDRRNDKELDERKAIGPGGVSGYILKECRQKMGEPIHDIMECSIKTEKVLKEWRRADIMSI